MDYRDLLVTPERWLPRGEALCTSTPRPLAIWQGIPGESSEVHVYHLGQNQWLGRWNRARTADPHRVDPPCRRYSPCGGCPLMHLDGAGQDLARRTVLLDAFRDVELAPPPVEPTVVGPDGDRQFRHVVKLAAGYSDEGHIRLGAYGRNSRDIITIPECLVATPALRRAMKVVAHHVIDLDVRPFESESGRGILRYVVLRQSRAHGEMIVTLVAARRSRQVGDLAQAVASNLPEAVGVLVHMNEGPGNAIFSQDGTVVPAVMPLSGRPEIEEEVAGLKLRVGSGEFFQTNPGVADLLYREVAAQVLPDRPVVDLYCGVGALALAASERSGWALGVEENETAVMRARESAARNRRPAEFLQGRVLDALPQVQKRLQRSSPTVILNPARRGLEEGVVDAVLALTPARMLYVSCNPRTLARDLAGLRDKGWVTRRVVPFDMFPNTSHLEVVVTLDPEVAPRPASARRPHRRVVGTAKNGD